MTDTLMGAILNVQRSLPDNPIRKDKGNPQFKSRYASLDAVMDAILPALVNNGLVWTTYPSIGQHDQPTLVYKLYHAETGDMLAGEMPLLLTKQDSQGLGSALTYCRRYSIMSVFGLTADDDDDGNAASRRPEKKAEPKPVNGQPDLASEKDVAEIREAAVGLERDQIKLAMAACGLSGSTRADQVPRNKVVAVIKALGMSPREGWMQDEDEP